MTTDDLNTALRNCATGIYPLEAGVALLISHGTFLHRADFTAQFITCGTSGDIPMAAIDWDAAITAQRAGELPCSGGERRSSSSQPASQAASPSASATPSPGLTTRTSPYLSPQSATQLVSIEINVDRSAHRAALRLS